MLEKSTNMYRLILLGCAVVAGFAGSLATYITEHMRAAPVASSDMCSPYASGQGTTVSSNADKLLFITCGGFLE